MIIYKEKNEDIEFRIQHLRLTEIALRFWAETKDEKFKEYAKFFGNKSKELKHFIDHGDYTEREKRRKNLDKMLKFKI